MLIDTACATKTKFQRIYRTKRVRSGYYWTLIMVSNRIFDFPVGIST